MCFRWWYLVMEDLLVQDYQLRLCPCMVLDTGCLCQDSTQG